MEKLKKKGINLNAINKINSDVSKRSVLNSGIYNVKKTTDLRISIGLLISISGF